MPVYVDSLMPCPTNPNWRWNESCHLFADTLDELHLFATGLGMKLEWFQEDSSLPHYDLTPGKRKQAVAKGAIEASRKTLIEYVHKQRQAKGTQK